MPISHQGNIEAHSSTTQCRPVVCHDNTLIARRVHIKIRLRTALTRGESQVTISAKDCRHQVEKFLKKKKFQQRSEIQKNMYFYASEHTDFK